MLTGFRTLVGHLYNNYLLAICKSNSSFGKVPRYSHPTSLQIMQLLLVVPPNLTQRFCCHHILRVKLVTITFQINASGEPQLVHLKTGIMHHTSKQLILNLCMKMLFKY